MLSNLRSSKFYTLIYIFYFLNVFAGIFFSFGIPGNIKAYNNSSSSMAPTIKKGDLSIVKIRNNYNYKSGDIIVFFARNDDGKSSIITHRIIKLGGNVYITKGDNNPNGQEIVIPRLIIGKVLLIIPYLGSYFSFLKTVFGTIFIFGLFASIIIATELENIHFILNSEN